MMGRYGVPSENGEKVSGMWPTVNMSVANTYFQYKDVHKYMRYRCKDMVHKYEWYVPGYKEMTRLCA